eukprot:7324813-Prymnesium_polylepis.1
MKYRVASRASGKRTVCPKGTKKMKHLSGSGKARCATSCGPGSYRSSGTGRCGKSGFELPDLVGR